MEKIDIEEIELIYQTKGSINKSLKLLAEKINEIIDKLNTWENTKIEARAESV